MTGQSAVPSTSPGDESLNNDVLPTTSSSVISATMPVTPESVRPHPKASFYARDGKTPRKRTKSQNSDETHLKKNRLEEEFELKRKTSEKKAQRKRPEKRNLSKQPGKRGRTASMKHIALDDESDDSLHLDGSEEEEEFS